MAGISQCLGCGELHYGTCPCVEKPMPDPTDERIPILLTREQAEAFLPIAERNANYLANQVGNAEVESLTSYAGALAAWSAIAEQLRESGVER